MRAYFEDLRLRIVAAVDGGMPRSAAARTFGARRATVKRYLALRRETGALAPRPRRGPPPIKMSARAAALPARLEAAPDATLAEHCAWYEEVAGVRVADTTMSRVIRRHLGWTRKNSPWASGPPWRMKMGAGTLPGPAGVRGWRLSVP
jgi:transposase